MIYVEKHIHILAQSPMLNRREILVISVLGMSCGRPSQSLKDRLPGQVQRAWILKQTETLPAEEAPAVVRSLGMRQAIKAGYEGNGHITVKVFEMNVEASAFELIQKWRQQDGLAMYKGPYFFVAEGNGPDQAAVSSFLRAFQQELKTT
jgi:hypothetical protein